LKKYEKEVQQAFLKNEEEVIGQLKKTYNQALKDINGKIEKLMARNDADMQHVIYQVEYQKALKKEIQGILDVMNTEQFTTISDYLVKCYDEGFVGTMYSLQKQGIPLCFPLDQKAIVNAVQTESKISNGLYNHLGENVSELKKTIAAEVSRGVSTGKAYAEVAQQISMKMVGTYENAGGSLAYATRIARTEGHRVQIQSAMDASYKAQKSGADIVKQWDSTLDSRTRHSHVMVDGEVRELDEKFSNGLRFPSDPHGSAAEVVNCRCALLQRARWALDEEELETLKKRAKYFGLDKAENFDDYQKKYLKAAEKSELSFIPAKTKTEAEDFAKRKGVKYVDYGKLPIETANDLNRALNTLPDDVRPVFVGDSSALEKYWGGKLPRSSKQYYGVTIDTFDGIHLGMGNGIDFDTNGQMVGISYSYRTADKITAAKEAAQLRYQAKHNGNTWFFNVSGETTPFHEMGHVYANIKGLPKGFESAAKKWSNETKCDMLSNLSEAWAEAWAAYHTGANELPDYIRKFIEDVAMK
jgi:hypothetical protein